MYIVRMKFDVFKTQRNFNNNLQHDSWHGTRGGVAAKEPQFEVHRVIVRLYFILFIGFQRRPNSSFFPFFIFYFYSSFHCQLFIRCTVDLNAILFLKIEVSQLLSQCQWMLLKLIFTTSMAGDLRFHFSKTIIDFLSIQNI